MLRARYPAATSEGGPGVESMDGDDRNELEEFRDQVRGGVGAATVVVA